MRVLHVVEATGGGTARHVIDLCLGLVERGVQVHVVYSPIRMDNVFKAGVAALEKQGVPVGRIPMRRELHLSDVAALAALGKYLRTHGPFALVHAHSSKAGGLARLLRLAGGPGVVYTPHGFFTLAPYAGRTRFFYELVERALSPLTAAIIAVSESDAIEAVRLGCRPEKVRLIPNGIRLEPGCGEVAGELRARWGVRGGDVVVGFVGRFVRQKRPAMLVEAFERVARKHPDVWLVMVGEGPLETELREKAARLGIGARVIWPGWIEGREAVQAFDIVGLSSDYEGFPYVLLEAMAAGVPIVSTKVGAAELLVRQGETGFVVPVGDVDAFARALDRLVQDRILRSQMA